MSIENKDVKINLLVTNELRKKYKLHCLEKDSAMSDRIRQLIEKDLNGEVNLIENFGHSFENEMWEKSLNRTLQLFCETIKHAAVEHGFPLPLSTVLRDIADEVIEAYAPGIPNKMKIDDEKYKFKKLSMPIQPPKKEE